MAKSNTNRQEKIERLKMQVAEKSHPQQSPDRKKRLKNAQQAADKIIAQSIITSQQN